VERQIDPQSTKIVAQPELTNQESGIFFIADSGSCRRKSVHDIDSRILVPVHAAAGLTNTTTATQPHFSYCVL
jgi:hypothetical protein